MPQCLTCGDHVTVQFARVFGDNEDTVHSCMGCAPNAELGSRPEGDVGGRDAAWLESGD